MLKQNTMLASKGAKSSLLPRKTRSDIETSQINGKPARVNGGKPTTITPKTTVVRPKIPGKVVPKKLIKKPASFEETSTKKQTKPTNNEQGSDIQTFTDSIQEFIKLLNSKNANDRELRIALKGIRQLVLQFGIPDHKTFCGSLRNSVWKILLGIYRIDAKEYISSIQRGPSTVADKIENDVFRTLTTDKSFQNTVSNEMIKRLLNAFVWKANDQPRTRLVNVSFTYVQGMNVLAAPFLYVMPELDAFFSFSSFIQYSCPLYVQPALDGVHCGIKLLDRCLYEFDLPLFLHLKKHGVMATVYAFPWVMTFSACIPPLNQVLKLWDFFLAYGVHLNILSIIAQLHFIRDGLLESTNPMKLLRDMPILNTTDTIKKVLELVEECPEDIYDMLVRHPYDATVYDTILELEDV
ncbi:rab-GTPase-TBC domain-containing protein [Globomyces pollinis-pini]|nr:rab-GTPase-TBC domain-containing protein [Globomyces pollinis-pini]